MGPINGDTRNLDYTSHDFGSRAISLKPIHQIYKFRVKASSCGLGFRV